MKLNYNKKGIGHLAYAILLILIVVVALLVFYIGARQSQLNSEANAEVTYFDTQPPIPTQNCLVLVSNLQRAQHDASIYAPFVSNNYFQNLADQYLSQIQSNNCSSS